jgi:hypothetical protein
MEWRLQEVAGGIYYDSPGENRRRDVEAEARTNDEGDGDHNEAAKTT